MPSTVLHRLEQQKLIILQRKQLLGLQTFTAHRVSATSHGQAAEC